MLNFNVHSPVVHVAPVAAPAPQDGEAAQPVPVQNNAAILPPALRNMPARPGCLQRDLALSRRLAVGGYTVGLSASAVALAFGQSDNKAVAFPLQVIEYAALGLGTAAMFYRACRIYQISHPPQVETAPPTPRDNAPPHDALPPDQNPV